MQSFFGTNCDVTPSAPRESAAVSLSSTAETLIVSEAGPYSACDVWCNVPAAWQERVVVRVYARVGASRVLARQVTLANAPVTVGEDATLSGLVASIRGRPCAGFEVTVQATAGDPLVGGQFYLHVWHANVEPSSAGGGPVPEVPTLAPLVAARLMAVDSGGNLREVRADAGGRILAGTTDGVTEHLLVSTVAGVSEAVFSRIASIDLAVPEGVAVTLTATIETSDPGNDAEVRLFNVTDAVVVESSLLFTSSTLAETRATAIALSTSLKTYELQLRLFSSDTPARAVCSRASLLLDAS